jgi:hypothetical protein
MRLLRLADVETGPNDRVYCYSRSRAILLAMALLGAAAWLVFHAITTGWKLGYYIAAVMVLFLELMRRFFTARFRPTNWLVRMNDEGMFIQFRSYLNYHLPAEDLTVVFLSLGELRSARHTRYTEHRTSALASRSFTRSCSTEPSIVACFLLRVF